MPPHIICWAKLRRTVHGCQAKWPDTSLVMLGPAAAEQVAAAAEEVVQQAEAAADTAAARARCELPGSLAARHLIAELEGAGGGMSRAGSCQLSQDESVAIAPANAEAMEAQETLLQLSKVIKTPGREGLQPQSSCNLAAKEWSITNEPLMHAVANRDQHAHFQAPAHFPAEQGHTQVKASDAAAAMASVHMGAIAPAIALVLDETRKAGSAVALFKPTPHRLADQLSDLFNMEQQIWEPHGVPDKGSLLLGAVPSKSTQPVARLVLPFAEAPALEPRGPANAPQTHYGESAFNRIGIAGGASKADGACERIKAYRPQTAQSQGGAQHADGSWKIANMEAG
jgi:hypothetical protein